MKKPLLAVLAVAVLPILSAACSASPDAPVSDGQAGTAVLRDGAFVVPPELADVVIVEAGRLVFPASALATLGVPSTGQILVSDRQRPNTTGKNPDGFLRKVTSFAQTAEGLVVATDRASLQEAVNSLDLQTTIQIPALTVAGPVTQGFDKVTTLKTGGTTVQLLDYSGTKLFDYDDSVTLPNQNTIGFHAFATVEKGTLSFSPSYDVGIKLGFLKVNEAHAIAKGQLDAELLIDTGVTLKTSLDSQSFTQLVAQQIFKSQSNRVADYTINLGSLNVGPLKMPVSAQFTADLDCDFAWSGGVEVKAGATASASISAGVKYENGTFSPVFDKAASFTPNGPNFTLDGAVRARCSITPKFALSFFGLAMADVSAEAHVGVGGALTCGGKDANQNELGLVHGDVDAGVSAKVHAKLDLLGMYTWEKECTLFSLDKSAQWDSSFVLPGGSSATCTPASNYNLPPAAPAQPELCFGTDSTPPSGDGGVPLIPGTCTHDTCTAGDKLGQQCDTCTMAVCAKDPYCCDTYWGLSCFADVEALCGKKCQ